MAKKEKSEKLSSAQKAEKRRNAIPKTTFEVRGKKYKFVVYDFYNGKAKLVTAVEALKDPAELERLVDIDAQGVIELVK